MPSRPPIQRPPKPSTATAVICVSSGGGWTGLQVLPPSDVMTAFDNDEARTVDFRAATVYHMRPSGFAANTQVWPESVLFRMPSEVAAKTVSPSRVKAKTVPSKGFSTGLGVFLTGA